MVHRQIDRDHFSSLKRSFISLDQDVDGVLSLQEFKAGYDLFFKNQFNEDDSKYDPNLAQT